MKVYIDLGAYVGETLQKAILVFPDFDRYIGFEPVPKLFRVCQEKLEGNPKVKMVRAAASTIDKKNEKFYLSIRRNIKSGKKVLGKGSTLLLSKLTGNLDKKRFIDVKCVDMARYIRDNFKITDYIVLKIDIEGKEYDLLEHLIETGAIDYVDDLYCEWHVGDKMRQSEVSWNRHKDLIENLNKLGYNLTGGGHSDEFSKIQVHSL